MTASAKASCLLLLAVLSGTAATASIGIDVDGDLNNPQNPELRSLCNSDKDIRNSAAMLQKELKNCVVVEGFLRVVLMEKSKQEDFERLSFPLLREVTGYVLFYRVNGLPSLGQLFPNLTLIRGNQLFLGQYALVVSEMPQLMELGLTALQLVMHGSVRIQKNAELCLAESLDWDVLAPRSVDNVFLQNNEACRPCDCPGPRGLCWGYGRCRVPAALTTPGGKDCDKNCVVGCRGTTNMDCTACAGPEYKGRCIAKCPHDLLLFRGRRCVTADWCTEEHPGAGGHNYGGGIVANSTTSMADRVCVNECPSGYLEVAELVPATKKTRRKCQPCKGPCKKVCDPASLHSVSNARNLKGCTIIDGSLEIEIHSGNTEEVERELTIALGQIQVIRGSLVVSRSRPLTSLHFFRSLRLINNTDPGRNVAIFINDNINLQFLFDWGEGSKTSSLAIGPGSKEATFFYNPRLCPEEIDKFAKVVKLAGTFNTYNGFTNACGKRTPLSSSVSRLEPESVVLTWPAWQPASEVMEYAIFVARAAARNVTEYSGSAQCDDSEAGNVPGDASLDGWAVLDVRFDKGSSEVSQLVPRLQPDTLYAFYIKTYTKDSKVNSPIKYFRTKPGRPTPPAAARAVAVRPASPAKATSATASATASATTPTRGTGALLVEWAPPPRPNGRLSHYVVVGELRDEDDRRQLAGRNFCEQPVTTGVAHESLSSSRALRRLLGPAETPAAPDPPHNCCCLDCCRVPLDEDQCERVLRGATDVRDACGHVVESLDRCAHVLYSVVAENLKMEDTDQNFPKTAETRAPALDLSEQWDAEDAWKRRFVRIERASASSTLVESLAPFGLYTVRVHACGYAGDADPGDASPLSALCGAAAMAAARTLPAPEVDWAVAPNATLDGDVLHMSWTEPPHPNGMVVAYDVRYRDRHRYEANEKCITRRSHRKKNGTIQILLKSMFPDHSAHHAVPDSDADRYVVQVRAVSLAGPGDWVDVKVRRVADSAPPASAKDAAGSGTAALAAVAVLLVLAVLAATLFVLRRRILECGLLHGDADTGRQRLVNPDLTDCWDIPDLPDAHAREDPEDCHAASRVQYQRGPERLSIASARVAARGGRAPRPGRRADSHGDWHWVTWPSDPDVRHPSLPPSPQRKDAVAVDTSLPSAEQAGQAGQARWHPTNPFRPDYMFGGGDDKADAQADWVQRPPQLASENPFLCSSDVQGPGPGESGLAWESASRDDSARAPGREGAFQVGVVAAAAAAGSATDAMHKSCSTDSFISVNLNGSEQAAVEGTLFKSVNNKDQK